jgi:3',5'-cyclic-AMP phosphodiesterase
MIIAQITDTHISLDARGAERIRDLEACVADVNALQPQPDIVIHTGDIAHNGARDEYDCAAGLLRQINAPLHVIPGNRDNRAELRRAFADITGLAEGDGFIHYTIDMTGLRLIALDSTTDTTNKGLLCPERLAFLETALGEDRETPTLLLMHHAPVDIVEAIDPFQFISRDNADEIAAIIAKNPQAKALICGHSHRAANAKLGNLPVSTAPSVASNLRQGALRKEAAGVPVYEVHEVGVDGVTRMETRAGV